MRTSKITSLAINTLPSRPPPQPASTTTITTRTQTESMEFVTGAMGSLLDKLGELLTEEYNLQRGVREQVQSLIQELEIMHAALRKVGDVPREQLDELVKLWASDVRELSYEMEDILMRAEDRREDGREATPNTRWLYKLMKMMGNWFSKGKACHQIAVAIKDINKQLQEVTNRHDRYRPSLPAVSTPIDPRLRFLYTEATELVGIHGKRDQDLIKLLSEGDDVSKKNLKIVSVVGFGGLGKTTLVTAVCNKIKGDFDCCAFVSIGRNPDVKKVFKDILLEINCTDSNLTMLDERQLIDKLRKFLESKRYLIIIDDIWDGEMWGVIKLAFSNGNNLGSRLITTTRKVGVSKACCSSTNDKIYKMEPLSDDDSQRLFYQRIFSDRNGCPRELEQVSKDILKKCGGVPLAIITIASLLASKQIKTEDEWYAMLKSIGRGLTEHACIEEMQRILSFSYYDLPYELKTCLLYLSTFPEDYEIKRDRLIWRWIAEGFIPCKRQQTSLFELGERYFDELINRSMIQPADIDGEGIARACRVHDMVLDLICTLSCQENFVTILDGTEESMSNLQRKVHRASLQNCKVAEATPLVSVSQVRSITIFRPAINLMPPLFNFDVLRVLDLEWCDLGESSPLNLRYVGILFHLRYLGLAHTGICELPAEIGKLQFLLVLDVRGNSGLRELPSTVVNLTRLMCLLVEPYSTRLPDGMGNLTSMEVLHRISTMGCPNIVKELRNLTRLRELTLYFDEEDISNELQEAFVESLCNLHSIQSLDIGGYFQSMDILGERWVPPSHLRSFVCRVGFSTLPACVERFHSHLSKLLISVKELRQEDLQILGRLPALRSLEIKSINETRRLLLVVSADWFPFVIFFRVDCVPTGYIRFQRGAMPRAQEVHVGLNVQMARDDGFSDFDLGLGNLLSLRQIYVCIHTAGYGEPNEAEPALRRALDAHPNHPLLYLSWRAV